MKYPLLFLSLLTIFIGKAQVQKDSIMLLDGKSYSGNIIENTDQFLTVITEFNIDKTKNKKFEKDPANNQEFIIDTSFTKVIVEKYRVFSYHQAGAETVLYTQNDEMDNFLTVDQARKAALGSYDGKTHYSTKPVFYSAAAISLGFCLLDTHLSEKQRASLGQPDLRKGFFARSPSIWPIASVLVLPMAFAIPSTKVRTKNLVNGIRGDQYYYAGFNSTTRQRRSFTALKGAASGLVLGYASYFIFQKNEF